MSTAEAKKAAKRVAQTQLTKTHGDISKRPGNGEKFTPQGSKPKPIGK